MKPGLAPSRYGRAVWGGQRPENAMDANRVCAPRAIRHSTVTSSALTRQLPFAISTLPSCQNEAVQFDGVMPLPISDASDSDLHQSRNSLAELIGVSSSDLSFELAVEIKKMHPRIAKQRIVLLLNSSSSVSEFKQPAIQADSLVQAVNGRLAVQ
jgi:hypothetical protein